MTTATLPDPLPLAAGDTDACLRIAQPDQAAAWFAFVEAHREAFAAWVPWVSRVATEADMQAWLAAHPAWPNGFVAGLWEGGDRLVGWVRTKKLDWHNEKGELAFALAPPATGRGLMTRAFEALLARWFGLPPAGLGLHRCTVRSSTEQPRASRFLTRLGFQHEGVIRETTRIGDRLHDDDLWGMLLREWRPGSATGSANTA